MESSSNETVKVYGIDDPFPVASAYPFFEAIFDEKLPKEVGLHSSHLTFAE